jgi:O-succinylbenzoate synthase
MGAYRKSPSKTLSTGPLAAVTPMEVDRVRRSVLDIVRKNIPNIRLVLDGEKNWTNQQVRLFGMMLNKVMPDLHHSFNEHTIDNKEVHELTYDELQQIALQSDLTEADFEKETIDGTYSSASSAEDAPDSEGADGL